MNGLGLSTCSGCYVTSAPVCVSADSYGGGLERADWTRFWLVSTKCMAGSCERFCGEPMTVESYRFLTI